MNSVGTFNLSFKYRFEAAHRFTKSCEDSCATPHGHTWFAEAQFESPALSLGGDDMVLEFSQLKRNWKSFIQGTVDHSFMHHHEDPILPALKSAIPKFRGLPFPGDPTTELIAMLFFAKLETMTRDLGGAIQPVAVVIRETPTNTVTFKANEGAGALVSKIDSAFDGWWRSADPEARALFRR